MRLPAPGARRLLLLPLLGALLGAATPAPAADEEPIDLEALQEQRAARGKAFTTGSRIARYIDAAAKALDDEKPEEARALLDKLNPKRLNPEERALWYRMRGYVAYYSADYAAAVFSPRDWFERLAAPFA